MAENRGTRARTQRVDRARAQRERQRERDKDEKARQSDRDRPAAESQAYGVGSRGRTWEDDRDRDREGSDRGNGDSDHYGDRSYGLTRSKRDMERIASAWTRAGARLFAGATDVLSNLVENMSDTFFDYRDDDYDRGRPRYRSSSPRGGRNRGGYDRDDDYNRPRRYRSRGGSFRFADRTEDLAGDLSTAVRDAARVFTRAADSFSRVYEGRDDEPHGRRRVYRDDDGESDNDAGSRGKGADRGARLNVEAGPKQFAVEVEAKDRGEGKRSSGEEGARNSEEE
jgi:hypothetical protein